MRQGNVFTFYFEGINAQTKPGFVNFIVKTVIGKLNVWRTIEIKM